jgi:hypothetical protein
VGQKEVVHAKTLSREGAGSAASEAVRVAPDRGEAEFASGDLTGLLREQQG